MRVSDLDENLILQLAEGNKNAFRELYVQTSGTIYGFALSILRNRHDAEDVMQEAYIKTFQGAVSYKPGGKPLAWMLTIVRNLCYNKIRLGKVCEDLEEYESRAYADDAMENVLDKVVLKKAMEVLEFDERQIVVLHAMTGMKHKEIAEILDVPVGTVLSKYHRALKKLRSEMERTGFSNSEWKDKGARND